MKEVLTKKKIKKLAIFDSDGTLLKTPEPKEGKKIWKQKTGKDWTFRGWWKQPDSLSTIFNIVPIDWILDKNKEALKEKSTYVVILTGRIKPLREKVQKWFDEYNIEYDEFILKPENPHQYQATDKWKKKKVIELINKFPELEVVEIWDDQSSNIEKFEELKKEIKNINIIVQSV